MPENLLEVSTVVLYTLRRRGYVICHQNVKELYFAQVLSIMSAVFPACVVFSVVLWHHNFSSLLCMILLCSRFSLCSFEALVILAQAGRAAGIDDDTLQEVLKQLSSPEVKARLKAVTDEALEYGVSACQP